MKRRDFALLAGTSLASSAALRPAKSQSATPDTTLLKTTLTPMGAERAGNEDGSIPAWTGGLVSAQLGPDTSAFIRLFADEQPLYTVSASNMAQYAGLLTPATQAQILKFGLTVKVYPTHRTAAAPQYVYDNTAKNAAHAQLDPRGGRFGFTGAYGGVPFPIIDTSDPLAGGAQLIWNHLTGWLGYSNRSTFNPGCVMINGQLIMVGGLKSCSIYPYYDPNGSLESFDGYYSKAHYWYIAPGSAEGQEDLVWHTTNVNVVPDITWTVLNGQGRVRKAPNMSFDSPNPNSNGIASIDESSCFYGNPSQYDWKFIEKKEMLVPYNCNEMIFHPLQENLLPHFPNPDIVRWEKHRVWVVEATLHPGIHNVNSKRRLYIDEDSWFTLLGEGYDGSGELWKAYAIYNVCEPSVPVTGEQGTATFDLMTGDYCYNGIISDPPYVAQEFQGPNPSAAFEPQEMAANASF
jgi:hypothetical protein